MNNNWRYDRVWQPKNPDHPYLHIAAADKKNDEMDEIAARERSYFVLHKFLNETLLKHGPFM
jgi:hypothetical protein